MTNEEIQVGEYVRTKCGDISKLLAIYNNGEKDEIYDFENTVQKRDQIKSHSHNIIDLIEERRLCERKPD